MATEYNGRNINYAVVESSLNPALPYFVGTAEIEEQKPFVFLSNDILPEWREPIVIHEMTCLGELRDDPEGCLKATQCEISLVTTDLPGYVEARLKFYRALLESPPDPGLEARISLSVAYLEKIHRNLQP